MAEARAPNPLVEQFRKGGVPKDVRLMAAQGALPLGPLDLLELLVYLAGDKDTEVREAADQSLEGQPAAELLPLFKDRGTPPEILAWGLRARSERELREACLQNTSLEDAAIEELAPSLTRALAELVVINQVRTGVRSPRPGPPSRNRNRNRNPSRSRSPRPPRRPSSSTRPRRRRRSRRSSARSSRSSR
jgi:hypothetical protein